MNEYQIKINMQGKMADEFLKVIDIVGEAIDKQYPDESENWIAFGHPNDEKTTVMKPSHRAIKKQAQLDILNKMLDLCVFDGHTVGVWKNKIEELIEEVKNENT